MLEVGGRTLLALHLDRLMQSGLEVFVATTTNTSDHSIVNIADQMDLRVFRGSEHDVLSRFQQCAAHYRLDIIVRVTSDCPLIDGSVISQMAQEFLNLKDPTVYLSNTVERTFPRGFDVEIFSRQGLEMANKSATRPREREHVTPYFYGTETGQFRIVQHKRQGDASQFRVTLDTPADFRLIKDLIELYGADKLSSDQIVALLEDNPELVEINREAEQRQLE